MALPVRAATVDPRREAWLAALNGVWGEHLVASGNPLAIDMELRDHGHALRLDPTALRQRYGMGRRRVLVLLHGLCMNDLQWRRAGHDHGRMLAATCGHVPLYLHYNSGRHVPENGRELSALLGRLVEAWPEPLDEISLLCHSMGGLVARSACHQAERAGAPWRDRLRHIVFLGTPHHGAPLERAGHWIDSAVELSPYLAPFARLGKSRSAGIKDLRHGKVLEEDDSQSTRPKTGDQRGGLALPAGVHCHAVAATRQHAPVDAPKRLRGDGLVPVDSALGRHEQSARCLDFAPQDIHIAYGCDHFDLLSSAAVGDRLQAWLQPD
jgi:hypothetical protein